MMEPQATVIAGGAHADAEDIAIISIAISLKRIADRLDSCVGTAPKSLGGSSFIKILALDS